MHDYTPGYASAANHRRSATEVYGTKTKHIVESLRQELAEKDLKVKVSQEKVYETRV